MEQLKIQGLIDNNVMPVHVASVEMPFKTHSNASNFPDNGEINTEPSMTIPDQSLSVQELVYRYTHGMELGGGRVGVWEEDEEIQFPANWDKLDLSEKHDFFEEKRLELEDLNKKVVAKRNQMAEEAKAKELEAAVAAKLKTIRQLRKGEQSEMFDEEPSSE